MKKAVYISLCIVLALVIIVEIFNFGGDKTVFAEIKGEKPIYKVATNEKKIAISFDAAWGADNTERLLDILDSYNVGATFFLVGFWIEKFPETVKEIDRRGYEIGNHSANHPQMSKLTKEQTIKEITAVNDAVYRLTGKTPCVFRPPFGDYNETLISTLNENGMHGIQWSIDSLDWKDLSKDEIIKRVTKKLECGDIILFHNNAKYTPDALPGVIEAIQAQGFTICSVSDLILHDNYYVDNCGVQRPLNN